MAKRISILILAPYCDAEDVGEAWWSYQWIRNLSAHAQITLLTIRRATSGSLPDYLPNVEVVQWPERLAITGAARFNSMLKPAYIDFYLQSIHWLRSSLISGRRFDIAHQMSPLALRYPTPLAFFPIPYLLGPQAGSLNNPPAFKTDLKSEAWYTRLRQLDSFRIHHDPLLRTGYQRAEVVIGVAPYVEQLLSTIEIKRFEIMSELGIDSLASSEDQQTTTDGTIRLAHVGRAVRSKGLIDSIRAIAQLPESIPVQLDVAGEGEETRRCMIESEKLGIRDKIKFHGHLPRQEIESIYKKSDIFLFPSFREPSGSVIYEAMRHGLPVITCNRGGPGFVVTDECGIRVDAVNPTQLASDLSKAIYYLGTNTEIRKVFSKNTRKRISDIGLWSNKTTWLLGLYKGILSRQSSPYKKPRASLLSRSRSGI